MQDSLNHDLPWRCHDIWAPPKCQIVRRRVARGLNEFGWSRIARCNTVGAVERPCVARVRAYRRGMAIRVECYAGCRGEQEPLAFWLGERRLAVRAVVDRWS